MSHSPEFYDGKIFDATMDAWRSTRTGHRVANGDGSPVKQTRDLARSKPWLVLYEPWARHVAKSFGKRVDRFEMSSKEFVVKVISNQYDASSALTSENVHRILADALGFSAYIAIDSVTEFNRAEYVFIRYSKIHAINEVRNILECSLYEAKMIVDTAASRDGKTSAFGVTVDYNSSFEPNAYHVARTC